MRKVDFLKAFGLAATIAPLATVASTTVARAGDDDPDAIVGLWEAVVKGDAVYEYIYAISRGSYVATGSIDERFQDFKYSPTMGAYIRAADGSFKYRERGYVFDLKGDNVGAVTSTGTLRLDETGAALHGPGTFTQYDLHAKPVFTEKFSMTATRLKV